MAPVTAASLLSLLVLRFASGFPFYADLIPNGHGVKDEKGSAWPGVGHQNRRGAGPRNPFGEDFKAAGFRWTQELCEKDSDGDGESNGLELGDPGCVWEPGVAPQRSAGISHPGFAESTTASALEAAAMQTSTTTPKPAPTSGPKVPPFPAAVRFGDRVRLRAADGSYVGDTNGVVEAGWAAGDDKAAFEFEQAHGQGGDDEVHSGDVVTLKTWRGKRLTLQGNSQTEPSMEPNTVHAFWEHRGAWQKFHVQKVRNEAGAVHDGAEISLLGHTSQYIRANTDGSLTASSDTPGALETFIVELPHEDIGGAVPFGEADNTPAQDGGRRLRGSDQAGT
mmetsp:Transcript_14910/g.42345  ORF Transcript_14910/g.42345 Transcript_14910/m.42345 type:complete len:336 (+) Transcript_14910:70-1077(+)